MTKYIQIVSACDVCQDAGTESPGETLSVSLTGISTFEIELCEEHSRHLTELVSTLATLGRKPDSAPLTPGSSVKRLRTPDGPERLRPHVCPECPKTYATRASLRGHLRDKHDTTLVAVGLAQAVGVCEVCGDSFDTPQGLGVHRSRKHGISPTAAAS